MPGLRSKLSALVQGGKGKTLLAVLVLAAFAALVVELGQVRQKLAAAEVRARQAERAPAEAALVELTRRVEAAEATASAATAELQLARAAVVEASKPFEAPPAPELPAFTVAEFQRLHEENHRLKVELASSLAREAAKDELIAQQDAVLEDQARQLAAWTDWRKRSDQVTTTLRADLSRAERAVSRAPKRSSRARWLGRLEATALAILVAKAL